MTLKDIKSIIEKFCIKYNLDLNLVEETLEYAENNQDKDILFVSKKYIEKKLVEKCSEDIDLQIIILDDFRKMIVPFLRKYPEINRDEMNKIYEDAFEECLNAYDENETLTTNIMHFMKKIIKEKEQSEVKSKKLVNEEVQNNNEDNSNSNELDNQNNYEYYDDNKSKEYEDDYYEDEYEDNNNDNNDDYANEEYYDDLNDNYIDDNEEITDSNELLEEKIVSPELNNSNEIFNDDKDNIITEEILNENNSDALEDPQEESISEKEDNIETITEEKEEKTKLEERKEQKITSKNEEIIDTKLENETKVITEETIEKKEEIEIIETNKEVSINLIEKENNDFKELDTLLASIKANPLNIEEKEEYDISFINDYIKEKNIDQRELLFYLNMSFQEFFEYKLGNKLINKEQLEILLDFIGVQSYKELVNIATRNKYHFNSSDLPKKEEKKDDINAFTDDLNITNLPVFNYINLDYFFSLINEKVTDEFELLIVRLLFGYYKECFYSFSAISNFFKISIDDLVDKCYEYLELYKKSLNNNINTIKIQLTQK